MICPGRARGSGGSPVLFVGSADQLFQFEPQGIQLIGDDFGFGARQVTIDNVRAQNPAAFLEHLWSQVSGRSREHLSGHLYFSLGK
jgi:hypothetical protein